MQNLQSVINQRGDNTARHPSTRYRTNQQQNDNGGCGTAHIGNDCILQSLPLCAIDTHSQHCTHSRGGEQRELTASRNGIATKEVNCECEQKYQHRQRNKSHKGRWSLY